MYAYAWVIICIYNVKYRRNKLKEEGSKYNN